MGGRSTLSVRRDLAQLLLKGDTRVPVSDAGGQKALTLGEIADLPTESAFAIYHHPTEGTVRLQQVSLPGSTERSARIPLASYSQGARPGEVLLGGLHQHPGSGLSHDVPTSAKDLNHEAALRAALGPDGDDLQMFILRRDEGRLVLTDFGGASSPLSPAEIAARDASVLKGVQGALQKLPGVTQPGQKSLSALIRLRNAGPAAPDTHSGNVASLGQRVLTNEAGGASYRLSYTAERTDDGVVVRIDEQGRRGPSTPMEHTAKSDEARIQPVRVLCSEGPERYRPAACKEGVHVMKRRIGSLCAALMVMGLSACELEAPAEPEQASQVQEHSEEHLHSERGGIGLEPHDRTLSASATTIEPRKSLAVTERTLLTSSFPIQDVFNQLAAQGGGFTGVQLFRQLWDTQNPSPGQADLHAVASYSHCTANGNTLNGFQYSCREAEGAQAASSTSINHYDAVGLYNRFDLAPANGANCGEYRLVYAKRANTPGGGRNFIIFEAVLPNPTPAAGLEGCRAIANFWRDLSLLGESVTVRAAKLRAFYFEGRNGPGGALLSNVPVIHIDNYGNRATATGQVRTNQFMTQPWMLHEFKLQRASSGAPARFVPVTVKTNPFGPLFGSSSTDPRAAQFRSHFLTQVASLAVNNVDTFNHVVPDTFNAGESDAQNFSSEADYLGHFANFGASPNAFRGDIQAKLNALGSTLTPENIVARAQALSCAGCHNLSGGADLGGGVTFPQPHQPDFFVHSTEFTEPGPEGERFQISPALTQRFLGHRRNVFVAFLDTPVRNAAFVSQSVPATVTAGQSFTVSITMKNMGTHAWTAGRNFRLGSQSPQDNTTWGTHRAFLSATDTIHQGQSKTFTFALTAPSTAGVYAFKWGMLQEMVTWFGTFSPTVSINVVLAP